MTAHNQWTPSAALTPLLSTTLALLYAIFILVYPPRHRLFALLLLALPTALAFKTHLRLTPWYTLNDTFGRFLYIWLAHMSHIVVLLEYIPPPNLSGAERVRQAWTQLFARWPEGTTPRPQARYEKHDMTRVRFCIHHIGTVVLCSTTSWFWDTHLDPLVPSTVSLARVLPARLAAPVSMTFAVCVSDALFFSTFYSCFAVFFVVLHFDGPEDWSLFLFGSLGEAWSVRRYWAGYWHDFVYGSFSAHVQLLTRGCWGMEKTALRRMVENALVFSASGLAHSGVRWIQTQGEGEVWCVFFWYSGQILALLAEGVAQKLWNKMGGRKWVRERGGETALRFVERGVGYVWVLVWMGWSVPLYLQTRNRWEVERLREKYAEVFARTGLEVS